MKNGKRVKKFCLFECVIPAASHSPPLAAHLLRMTPSGCQPKKKKKRKEKNAKERKDCTSYLSFFSIDGYAVGHVGDPPGDVGEEHAVALRPGVAGNAHGLRLHPQEGDAEAAGRINAEVKKVWIQLGLMV